MIRALLAAIVTLVFSATALAQETKCVDVEWGSDAMVALMKENYIVHLEKRELRPVEFVGVGLEFSRDGMIVGVVRGGAPADQAGVPLGGKIVAVDGISTQEFDIEKVVEIIRGSGEEGTVVRLSIEREDLPTKVYTLTRAKIKAVKEITILRMCKARFFTDIPRDK